MVLKLSKYGCGVWGGLGAKYGQYMGGWGRSSSNWGGRHQTGTCEVNSVPPERVFSVLNDTFEDDMDSAHADYIELSLQLQYNGRSRNM